MQIIEVELSKLKEYENNPRHNEKAVEAVQNSIASFGFKVPIVIDKDFYIVAGHTRRKAALNLNLNKVPCIIADDLSDEQIKAYRLVDNKTAELAEWDFTKLEQELLNINIDMEAFGFDPLDFELDPTEAQEDNFDIDAAADEITEPITKVGDIYQLGKHRLMCGDSTDKETLLKLMDGVKADMVFTDPPWNVNYGAVEDNNPMGYKNRTILNDYMSTNDFKDFMYNTFNCMNTVSKDGCMTYVVMSAQEWGNMMLTLKENDYHWSSTIIWNKDRLVLSRKDYHTKYEPIWYGWKNGASRLHPLDDRKQSDVWDYERPTKSDEHPTMKPVPLVANAINNSSNKGDIVLDLFGGSGTTLIACEETNRVCYMNELDPKYCDVIIKRWETLTGNTAKRLEA